MCIFHFTEFSSVIQMLTTYRNRLDIVGHADLTLLLTSKETNIEELIKNHQPEGSH